MFENYRWRKYLSRVGSRRYLDFRKHYGSFLCRRWNQANGLDDRLTDFNIYRLTEKSAAPGQSASVKRTRIWRHWCVEDVGDLVEPALKSGRRLVSCGLARRVTDPRAFAKRLGLV